MPQPLLLPAEQNPLAAYLLARLPRPNPGGEHLCADESAPDGHLLDLAVPGPVWATLLTPAPRQDLGLGLMGGSSAAARYGLHATPDY